MTAVVKNVKAVAAVVVAVAKASSLFIM